MPKTKNNKFLVKNQNKEHSQWITTVTTIVLNKVHQPNNISPIREQWHKHVDH